jgi:hypothetical protein
VLGVLTAQTNLQDAAAVKGVVESTETFLNRPPESYGVWGEHRGRGGAGVYGNGQDFGVYGYALGGTGVQGFGQDQFIPGPDEVTVIASGVVGNASGFGAGVAGGSQNGPGVEGASKNFHGVIGRTFARDGNGVLGEATQFEGTGVAIFGRATGTNVAGRFEGNVQINGTLSKSAGSFKIDHPLDPANKYLSHSFVESPEMLNVYRGNVVLDGRGASEVTLPSYFEALNVTYSYQLTAIGAPAPNLHVASEISGGRFTIAGGQAGQKVCWQVTGARQDVYAKANPIVVEEDKPANERGTYLQPEAHGQGADKAQPAVVALAKQAAEARVRDEQLAQQIARR